ncbi:hypothetical protein MG290_02175 [Flavobacterium sp. CBA20B-1]|uniref:hypothetical protein n=1 Tax=unclassified Flavobacterium TaxID=196869 RepID=UPI002224C67E|nr:MULTISPECIES: hypothetical protein [unclassified Flavobacterium]WCM42500.1 hypothetical protein MG290_02175 [Flavobacterium sp. CBA20B-1]
MDDQKIQELINQFDSEKLKENAYFGIFEYGGGNDESYIKANKEGLLLYSMYMLIASKNINTITDSSKDKTIPFEHFVDWIDEDSSTIIGYIEKFQGKRKGVIEPTKSNFYEKLIPIGCFLLFIIFGVCFFVGLAEIISWFS